MNKPSPSQIQAAAAALVNQKVMRKGSPPIKNILDIIPAHLREEVEGDALAALEAVYALEDEKP